MRAEARPTRLDRTRGRRIARVSATLLVPVVVAGSACGYTSKKHAAQRVIDSVDRLEAAGTAKATMSMTFRIDKTIALTATTRPPKGAPAPLKPTLQSVPATVELDLAHLRAATTPVPPKGPAQNPAAIAAAAGKGGTSAGAPDLSKLATITGAGNVIVVATRQVFNRGTLYLLRPNADPANTDEPAWVDLDFSKDDNKRAADLTELPLVNIVNPTYLLQLLAGTLSGSVKVRGVEDIGGVRTTRYEVNIDRDKAVRRMKDKDRRALENAFTANRLVGTIYKHAQVWLDDAGLPHRVVLPLRQSITRDKITTEFAITVTMDLSGAGSAVDVKVPAGDATAGVDSLPALYQSARASS